MQCPSICLAVIECIYNCTKILTKENISERKKTKQLPFTEIFLFTIRLSLIDLDHF